MRRRIWLYTIYILFLTTILSVFLILSIKENRLLIIGCDVGQGDAFLIQKKTVQILIDGGRGSKVVDCLSKYVPFWDREIELVVSTQPDLDHYEGLISVFKSYHIKSYLSTSLLSDAKSFELLTSLIKSENPKIINAKSGVTLNISNISMEVLHPAFINSLEGENNQSVVILLKYGKFDALFTADIEDTVSDEISGFQSIKNLEYLKIPHHGSKNGLSQKLFDAVSPEISVVSSGRKNSYGHPHKEVLEILKSTNILRTDEMGDVVVATDGTKYNIQK